jgi:hypothetical protein
MRYPDFAFLTVAQVPDAIALMARFANLANKNINTSYGGRVGSLHQNCNFSFRAEPAARDKMSDPSAPGEEPEGATGTKDAVPHRMRQSRAMASARKPVIVRKFSRDWFAGYAGVDFGQKSAELEILDLSGKVVRMGWEQVKWVCYVRDFPGGSDQTNPERLVRKRFALRPRTAGLWLRMKLADGDELDGLAANDRTLVDGAGLLLTPPDTRSNTQRIYVPRQAIQELEVISLVGTASRKRAEAERPRTEQPELFGEEETG